MDIISFYETERRDFRSEDNSVMSMYDKKKLKLDLTNKVNNNAVVLTSPDLKLLKLDSPELERIILATAGSATPTPKQYRRVKGTSDLTVKEQQEQYVRGFEDALNKMRQEASTSSNTAITSTVSNIISNNNNNIAKIVHDTGVGLNGALFPFNTVTSNVSNTSFPSTTLGNNTSTSYTTISTQDLGLESLRNDTNRTTRSIVLIDSPNACVDTSGSSDDDETDDITAAQLLVEPVDVTANTKTINMRQDVSEGSICPSSTSTSGLSTVPIDLHKQEIVKTERKKHRNRVAASKCRKRKLERESTLQETVDELKTRNGELSEIAATLRQQVCELKLQVMDHVKSGCEVLVNKQPIQVT